ncbi:sulfite exporter TauE/SafE family protein [Qipengyuania sp. MTN3-11]|uniref:sulfite exporter TauE/SafE family protein n=1 Tax=Qipengyuania sp. MTN3-11 TaxID=3056557 RepID=UPI0036F318AD
MDILAGYAPLQIGVALLAAFGSAFVRGLTGFGMAILLVPVLALAMVPVDAVLLANFLSLFIGLVDIRRLVQTAERSAWTLCLLVLLFTPAGLWALAVTSPDLARFVIALIALSAFVAIYLPRASDLPPGRATTAGVGVLSGLMTGYAGMPGPPVVPYYVRRDLPRATAKASMLLVFTAAGLAGLGSGAALGVLDWRLAILALLLFPAVVLGNKLGERASDAVGDRAWRIAVGIVLGGAAGAALWRLV